MTPENPKVSLVSEALFPDGARERIGEFIFENPDAAQVYTSRGHWGTLKEVLEKADQLDSVLQQNRELRHRIMAALGADETQKGEAA